MNYQLVFVQQTHPKIVPANTISKTMIGSWDSLGTLKVIRYEGPNTELETIWAKGNFFKGLKNGDWKGYENGELIYEENYNQGELTKETTYNLDGSYVEYDLVIENAEFPGDIEGWFKYLRKNLKYPKKAKRAGTEGIVHLNFVVDTDGTVKDVEVISGIGDGCD